MDKKKLQGIIQKLHRELATADSVDNESRAMLLDLVRDVENLTVNEGPADGGAENVAGQLENAALRFESEHPKLSMALGEVIEALNKLGI